MQLYVRMNKNARIYEFRMIVDRRKMSTGKNELFIVKFAELGTISNL